MAKIKNIRNKRCCVTMWKNGNSLTLLVGMQTGAATLENSMEVPQKLKIELPYDPAIALLGIYPQDTYRCAVSKGQRERHGVTESEAGSSLRAVSTEPHTGLKPTNCEIMT